MLQDGALARRLGAALAERYRAAYAPDYAKALEVALYKRLSGAAA